MSLQEELALRRCKMLLVACGRKDLTLVKDLIEKHKVDVNYRNVHGETPLYAACEGGALNVVQYLLSKGANLDKSKTNSHQLPIHAAAASADIELLTVLVGKKQSLSATAYDGTTPLHVAIRQGQIETTKWMLCQKVDVNKGDHQGNTPLHSVCAMVKRRPFVELLVDYGAKLNPVNVRGEMPLYYALRRGDREVVTFLIEMGAKTEDKYNNVQAPVLEFMTAEAERYKKNKKDITKAQEEAKKKRLEADKADANGRTHRRASVAVPAPAAAVPAASAPAASTPAPPSTVSPRAGSDAAPPVPPEPSNGKDKKEDSKKEDSKKDKKEEKKEKKK